MKDIIDLEQQVAVLDLCANAIDFMSLGEAYGLKIKHGVYVDESDGDKEIVSTKEKELVQYDKLDSFMQMKEQAWCMRVFTNKESLLEYMNNSPLFNPPL